MIKCEMGQVVIDGTHDELMEDATNIMDLLMENIFEETGDIEKGPANVYDAFLTAADFYRTRRRKSETKSRRVQCLFRPSSYEAAKKLSDSVGISVNEFLSNMLDEVTRGVKV